MIRFDVNSVLLRGMNLVEASAGTGKTHAIATLYLRLLVETDATVDQILVVTFTEAATSELRERIRARIQAAILACAALTNSSEPTPQATSTANDNDEFPFLTTAKGGPGRARLRLTAALHDFDDAQISTIHGFCQRMLLDRAFESDILFDSELLEDIRPLIDEIARDYWARETWNASPDFARWVSSHFNLETARKLGRKACAHANLALLPDEGPIERVDGTSFRAAFAHARELWDRGAVSGLVQRLKGHYKRFGEKWCADLDAVLSAADPSPQLPDVVQHFRSEKVAKNSTGVKLVHPFFFACDELSSTAGDYAAALDRSLLAFKRGWIRYLTDELERRKQQRGVLSFDDLLRRLDAALRGESGAVLVHGIAQRYRAALIDEFQDTDDTQYRIFERICRSGNITTFLIGDPKQAIYSFRGADVFAYMQAVGDTPPTQRYTMTTNYRSDPNLVSAVTRLFRRARYPFLLADITCPEVAARPGAVPSFQTRTKGQSAAIELGFVDSALFGVDRGNRGGISRESSERLLSQLTATEIALLLARGDTIAGKPVRAQDIAVLTRTNLQAFAVQAALRQLGVYGVVIGDRSVYLSEEARELQFVLSAALEPNNRRCLRAALSTELIGKTATELGHLEAAEDEWDAIVGDFRRYNVIWIHHNFVQMLRALMRDYRVDERLLALRDGERRMTNLLHLLELLHSASRTLHLGPHALTHYLAEQRRSDSFAPDSEQIRLESDRDAVTLTTVHKSKGLQYPIVYCPFVALDTLPGKEDGKAPVFHQESDRRCTLDLGSVAIETHRQRSEREQFSENLRLLYVALTRARHRVSVFWGRFGGFDTSALGYLLFPPSDSIEEPAPRTVSEHLKSLDEAATLRSLEALSLSGELEVRHITRVEKPPPANREASQSEALDCRTATRAIDRSHRTSSFTSFTREHRSHGSEPTAGRDWDDQVGEDLWALSAPPSPGQAIDLAAPITLADFPRGARAGNFFHEIFEHSDFSKIDGELIAATLRSYGYDPIWGPSVEAALMQITSTPLLTDSDLSLQKVTNEQRLNELEFFLPVRNDASIGDSAGFDPSALARVFEAHPSAALPSHYAAILGQLSFLPLRGFVRGFIDLVFEHSGRYYIVDYKTNHLGNRLRDYRPSYLSEAMVTGHYFLQYHLYALAVHRYLSQRKRGYDYEQHFGGVLYLFIKGMTPESGTEAGVFFERPPKERLLALSNALDRPERI